MFGRGGGGERYSAATCTFTTSCHSILHTEPKTQYSETCILLLLNTGCLKECKRCVCGGVNIVPYEMTLQERAVIRWEENL